MDEKIQEAIRLLQQHDDARAACIKFLRENGDAYSADPISLKLWIADRMVEIQSKAR